MPLKFKILTTLAALHAALVVCGASGLHFNGPGAIPEVLNYYSVISGAERGFGFFAPSVNSQARITFHILDRSGQISQHTLGEDASDESVLRIDNIGSKFWQILDSGNRELRDAFTASWAGKVFASYPEAQEVTINLETYQLVSMDEFRAGKRPEWAKVYAAKFSR